MQIEEKRCNDSKEKAMTTRIDWEMKSSGIEVWIR